MDLAFALNTLDGRYHVVDRIAAGGMGEVFRAHDAVLERPVAIKVLHRSLAGDAGFVERFRREARAAASLNHQNIVAVHDWASWRPPRPSTSSSRPWPRSSTRTGRASSTGTSSPRT